jgi:hypothetical protein
MKYKIIVLVFMAQGLITYTGNTGICADNIIQCNGLYLPNNTINPALLGGGSVISIPYWIPLSGNITSNSSILNGNVHVSGRLSQGTSLTDGFYSVSFGKNNNVFSPYCGIGSGENNLLYNDGWTVISGGFANTVSRAYSGISSGKSNIITSFDSVIAGGDTNMIIDDTPYSFIGGGAGNNINVDYASSYFSSIVGGASNYISGDYGFIGGGWINTVGAGYYGFVGGGTGNNCWVGSACFVGGGESNTVSNSYSSIVGGQGNIIGGDGDGVFIGGGISNYIVNSAAGFIGSGNGNTVEGDYSAILNGVGNTITASNAYIIGTGLTDSQQNSLMVGWSANRLVVNVSGVWMWNGSSMNKFKV